MDQPVNKNRDVRRLSAYHDIDHRPATAGQSFDSLLKEIEERRKHPSRTWYVIAAGILVLVAGSLFFVWKSASLKVVLTPKKIVVHPEGQIVALPFEKISLKETLADANLPFTVKKVGERSRGTIVVYNAHSTEPYRFVARTRFESPDGNIYRIEKPLLIPGGTKKDGEFIPGSIEVEVIADEPGEAANKEFADFTVPGLKGSVLFEKFYARSKGPISGGRKGEERVVDREAIASETFAAQERLFGDKLRAQMPDGFLLPEAAWFADYHSGDSDQIEAEITGFMVKRDDLGAKLASLFFEPDQAGRVILVDDSRLSLKNLSSFDAETDKENMLRIMVEGEVMYTERITKEEVPSALAKLRSSEEIDAFLKNLGSVESATLIFSPAFLKRVPSNPNRITIDVAK